MLKENSDADIRLPTSHPALIGPVSAISKFLGPTLVRLSRAGLGRQTCPLLDPLGERIVAILEVYPPVAWAQGTRPPKGGLCLFKPLPGRNGAVQGASRVVNARPAPGPTSERRIDVRHLISDAGAATLGSRRACRQVLKENSDADIRLPTSHPALSGPVSAFSKVLGPTLLRLSRALLRRQTCRFLTPWSSALYRYS